MEEPTQNRTKTILATVKQGIVETDLKLRADLIIRTVTLNILKADYALGDLVNKNKPPPTKPQKIVCRTQDHINPQLEVIDKKEEKLTEKKVVDPEELQFMKDMENTKIEGDAFYQTLLTESQGRIDTYNMEVQVGELKEEISKLTLQLRQAESKIRSKKSELEIKAVTIEALKEASTKHLKHRDIAAMHLKLKSEQVTSLKGSIETLKLSLEEVLSEKTDVIGKLSGMEDSMAQIKADHKKLQESYENSLEDLKTMPEFKAIQNLVQQKEEEILHQQEAKEVLKNELVKSREAWKQEEEKMLDVRQAYEDEIKAMQNEMQELSRSMSWSQEELVRMESKVKEAEAEALRRVEEATELRIKLRSIETEIKAGVEVEKMKAQVMVESMQNELRWREKLFKTQLETVQKQADVASLDKLRLQKQMTQFEAALQDDRHTSGEHQPQPPGPSGNHRQTTPRNKRLLMKHRYLEMENIDQEIARLKHDMMSRSQYQGGEVSLPPIYNEAPVERPQKFFEAPETKSRKQRARKTKRSARSKGGWN